MPKTSNPFAKKKSSAVPSPFSRLQRTKSSLSRNDDKDNQERLDEAGGIPSLAPPAAVIAPDVISLWRHIYTSAFDEIPDRAAGMGSERISEILRFRKNLPPIVSMAHLQALSASATQTEREMASLLANGTLRKVMIPGRGKGGAAIGDGLVLVDEWKARVVADDHLSDELKQIYLRLLSSAPREHTVLTTGLASDDVHRLVVAGWLTSPAALSPYDPGTLFAPPGTSSSLLAISKSGSRAAAGTLAAVGGYGAIQEHGGGGSMLATKETRPARDRTHAPRMTLSMPGMGAYLKLLTEARLHLLFLLKQISPRYREATYDMLKEKWDGNTLTDAVSRAKRARGEFAGVLPGKTKRWRDFYGLDFEWTLAECVGSGVVELFNTGSVGMAIRAR